MKSKVSNFESSVDGSSVPLNASEFGSMMEKKNIPQEVFAKLKDTFKIGIKNLDSSSNSAGENS